MKNLKNQTGQAVIVLLLIMLIALTIGLTITARSLNDLSTSNKLEQSSRAFSAAEAGIETALQNPSSAYPGINLGNQSSANVNSGPLPDSTSKQALEYPPIGKETIAQFWLADPNNGLAQYDTGSNLTLYWGYGDPTKLSWPGTGSGNNSDETPALDITLIYQDSSNVYQAQKYYVDPLTTQTNDFNVAGGRQSTNHFNKVSDRTGGNPLLLYPALIDGACDTSLGTHTSFKINTSNSNDTSTPDRWFRCYVTIQTPASGTHPLIIRVRFLYTNLAQPLALKPTTKALPAQATIFTSKGTAGQASQTIQVFQIPYVVPSFFDYAIFSAGDLTK